jgi:hypothetical protein
VVRDEQPGGPYQAAIQRAFQFAHAQGRACDPADFLVGLAAGSGAAAAALHPGSGLSLADIAAVSGGPSRQRGGYLHMQAQEAATSLAAARDQPVAPEHLLIALLDQGTPEVLAQLRPEPRSTAEPARGEDGVGQVARQGQGQQPSHDHRAERVLVVQEADPSPGRRPAPPPAQVARVADRGCT